MRKIYKYLIDLKKVSEEDGTLLIDLPEGAILLTVGTQIKTVPPEGVLEEVFLWALVDPQSDLVQRRILVLTTGGEADEPLLKVSEFVGTVHFTTIQLVFHIFDCGLKGTGIPTKVWDGGQVIQFPQQYAQAASADDDKEEKILH